MFEARENPWIPFVVAVIGFIAGVTIQGLTAQSEHDAEIRAERAKAYSAYFASNSDLNEFIYRNLYWTKDGVETGRKDTGVAGYWEGIAPLQSRLDSNHWIAKIAAAGDDETEALLDDIRWDQQNVLLRFKCMTEIQPSHCEDPETGKIVGVATPEVIAKTVDDWAIDSGSTFNDLYEKVRLQLE
jgi:hypothetical protein